MNSELTDNITFFDIFEEQCRDICSGVNFNLAIIQLQKDKHIYVFEDKGRKVCILNMIFFSLKISSFLLFNVKHGKFASFSF